MLGLRGEVGLYLALSAVSGKMSSTAKSAGVTVTHSVWIGRLHQESSHPLRKTWCKVWQQWPILQVRGTWNHCSHEKPGNLTLPIVDTSKTLSPLRNGKQQKVPREPSVSEFCYTKPLLEADDLCRM